MDAKALYELVKGHEDVWADYMTFQDEGDASFWSAVIDDVVAVDSDEAESWKGGEVDVDGAAASLFSETHAELILIGLFAVATGYAVRFTTCENPENKWRAVSLYESAYYGASPIEALVRAREAWKERGDANP